MNEIREDAEKQEKKLEIKIALVITLFAAILAINGLFGGKYGDDEMQALLMHSQMYTWYQSKSQKKILAESKRDMIETFEKSGMLHGAHQKYLDSVYIITDAKIAKYEKEINEIQFGSSAVGKENWAQEQDGQLGQIIGAEEYQQEANRLGKAGDFFDFGDLALNLCLVMGAISLILHNPKEKLRFLMITTSLGMVGSFLTFYALYIAMI